MPYKTCNIQFVNPSIQCSAPAICFVLVHTREIFPVDKCIDFCEAHLNHEFGRSLDERGYYWSGDVIPIPPWVVPRPSPTP